MNIKNFLGQKNIFRIKFVQGQEILGQVCQPLCLKEDDLQVFFMHFRRYGSVRHGFYIPLDGSERRAEVMGYVGYKLLLVVFHIFQLGGHVV